MSARGFLVINPNKKSSKIISESKRYIPLLWFSFLSVDDCDRHEVSHFELDRNAAIKRAEACLPFLTEVFSDIRVFDDSATTYLARLKRLRCETIGVDVAELTEEREDAASLNLRTAVEAIESRNASFKLLLPSRKVDNPFGGKKISVKAREIASTRELLLEVAWLTPGRSLVMPRDLEELKDEDYREFVTGYVWE